LPASGGIVPSGAPIGGATAQASDSDGHFMAFGEDNINPEVVEVLKPTITDPYHLNDDGCHLVYASNQGLTDSYYDQIDYPIDAYTASCYERIYDVIPLERRRLLLDVCCGTGRVAINVMKHHGFQQCIAIDINATAVRRMKAVATDHDLGSIQPVIMNIMKTGFAENSFDCVMGSSFLHHLPRNLDFLIEMHRILKPGGVLCLACEPTTSAPLLEDFFFRPFRAAFKSVLQKLRSRHGSERQVCLSDIWLYDQQSLDEMLRKAGFRLVIIQPFGLALTLVNKPLMLLCRYMLRRNWIPHVVHKWLSSMDRLAARVVPANLFSHFTIIARKG